jgi:phosphatidylserine decarboxylase
MTKIQVWDRQRQKIYFEKQYHEATLKFLYHQRLGQSFLPLLTLKMATRLATGLDYLPSSQRKITSLVQTYGINLAEYEATNYPNFATFFCRKIKPERRPITKTPSALIAPADSKLSVYKLNRENKIKVKNQNYTLGQLLRDDDLAVRYQNGLALIFRLTIDDYHHFCFIDAGRVLRRQVIKGKLHNVGPIGQAARQVWAENYRHLSCLALKNFGEIVQLEVGAMLVGKIINYPDITFTKGQAKGYFALGGSTVILIFPPGVIKLDADIVKYNRLGYEVKVRLGEKIGQRC